MRVMVTGCAGFIGSHLCERLLADGHEVLGVDCFTDYYRHSVKETNIQNLQTNEHFRLSEADLSIADLRPLVDGIDVIYHEAAQPGVRASWGESFDTYVLDNVLATQRLLEAAKDQPIQKFVYASSSSIYGDAESFPTRESVLPRPVSPYGVTKLAGEQLTHLYWRNYGVPTIALRYFTVYGPRQRPDMAFHRFIRWGLDGQPIQVFGDGEQTRDFTFVGDAVQANVAAASCAVSGVACNIGGGSRVSVNQVLTLLGELLDRPLSIHYSSNQRGDVRHTAADTGLAADLLGYAPRVDLRSGLAAEVAWLRHSLGNDDRAAMAGPRLSAKRR